MNDVSELIERFAGVDNLRWQIGKPWGADGMVYATNGRIAIRIANVYGLDYEKVQGGDWRETAARQLDGWILESRASIGSERIERIEPNMSLLRKSAYTAMYDARKYAVDRYPDTTDDIEEMTVGEFVDRCSVVILPGAKRHVIAAKYAVLVCDAVDAFGPVEFHVPADGFKRGDYGRYRIWCHGTGFDILLMCIRSDNMDAHGMSVADSETATLVKGLTNDSFVPFRLLQFGKWVAV